MPAQGIAAQPARFGEPGSTYPLAMPLTNKIPLTKLKVRPFITNIENNKKIKLSHGELTIRGIAFDSGIRSVDFSIDGGKR